MIRGTASTILDRTVAAVDPSNPTLAINPKYSSKECSAYLVFARCVHRRGYDSCPTPSQEQVKKCCPIDPRATTQLIVLDQQGQHQLIPKITGYGFSRMVQEGNYPNPN